MPEKFLSRSVGLKEEIIRKFIHISSGILISFLYTISQKDMLIIGLPFLLLIILCLEALRFKGVISVPFLRGREEKKIGGHAFFILGAFISILVFPKQIAIASILILAIGDTASGIVQAVKGKPFESREGYKKRIKPPEVILVMFCVSFLVAYFIVNSITIAISGAIGATIADGVYIKIYGVTIDDNLTIPLYSGFLMSLGAIW